MIHCSFSVVVSSITFFNISSQMTNSDIVHLNVGGTKFVTTRATLRKYPNSMLGAMFMENIPLSTDKDGCYFIDRCGSIFQYILQFLRCGELILPKGFNELELLEVEADFYQIDDLMAAIEYQKVKAIEDQKEKKIEMGNDDVDTFIFCNLRGQELTSPYNNSNILVVYQKSKHGCFRIISNGVPIMKSVRSSKLKKDGWVLKEEKNFSLSEASMFFIMRGIPIPENIYNREYKHDRIDLEIWNRN